VLSIAEQGGLVPNIWSGFWGHFALLGFAVFFCKDCINGRSPAKRILKLQVVDNVTGTAASPLQCFVRDLFMIIWPIEGIVALINPERRIGDRVAGTKLVVFDPVVTQPETNVAKVLIALLLGYGLIYAVTLPFKHIMSPMSGMSGKRIDFVRSSLNEPEGLALQHQLSDSLSNYKDSLSVYNPPYVRIYDSIQHSNLKYILVSVRLKENYLSNPDKVNYIDSVVAAVIYQQYPKQTFSGYLEMHYDSMGQGASVSMNIGTITDEQILK
jgi:hypothetical protein